MTGRAAAHQKLDYGPAAWHQFKVGDLVVRYHAPLARVKLAKNWDGPFMIIELVSETTIILKWKGRKIP